jgi:hypothetical protein
MSADARRARHVLRAARVVLRREAEKAETDEMHARFEPFAFSSRIARELTTAEKIRSFDHGLALSHVHDFTGKIRSGLRLSHGVRLIAVNPFPSFEEPRDDVLPRFIRCIRFSVGRRMLRFHRGE